MFWGEPVVPSKYSLIKHLVIFDSMQLCKDLSKGYKSLHGGGMDARALICTTGYHWKVGID